MDDHEEAGEQECLIIAGNIGRVVDRSCSKYHGCSTVVDGGSSSNLDEPITPTCNESNSYLEQRSYGLSYL